MIELKGKKALVTGASSGIGKSVALRLAGMGAQVAIHYHNHISDAELVLETIKKGGGYADIIQADLAIEQKAIDLGARAWQMMNGIDILINNAGVSYKKHFLDTTIEDVDHFTNINFRGTLLLTQTVTRLMVQ